MATIPKDKDESRAEMLGLEYPKPPDGLHIVQALMELGWCENNEFGTRSLSWSEIKSYADATDMLSEPWEFRCVREMSTAYAIERNHNEPLRIAPDERVKQDD